MKKYLCVKFQADYSDEFDVYGLWITTQEELDVEFERVKAVFSDGKEKETYFGTNEAVTWFNYDDWVRCHKIKEITLEEYNFLLKTVGNLYGHVLAPSEDY